MKGDIVLTVFLRIRYSVQMWQTKDLWERTTAVYFTSQSQMEKGACTYSLLHDPTAARIVHCNCLKSTSIITKIRKVRTNRLNRRREGDNCHSYLELLDWSQVNKEYKLSYNPCLAMQFIPFWPLSICWARVHCSRGQSRAPNAGSALKHFLEEPLLPQWGQRSLPRFIVQTVLQNIPRQGVQMPSRSSKQSQQQTWNHSGRNRMEHHSWV